jgi:hypothetical protein
MFLARLRFWFGSALRGDVMSAHVPSPPEPATAELALAEEHGDAADAEDGDRTPTIPDTQQDSELLEAIEWLKKAGVVSDERPAFSRFFDELAENTDTGSREPEVPPARPKEQSG